MRHGRTRSCDLTGGSATATRVTRRGSFDLWPALVWVLALAAPPAALGQLSNLDPAQLIDGLAKEQMNDLLLRLVETEPLEDPVLGRQIEIAQLRLEYARLAAEADQARTAADPAHADELAAQSRQAFDRMLETARRLIDEFYGHEQRPIWQTDLAEMLLIEYLQVLHRDATAFYEFGVPTHGQRQAYDSAVVEALEAMTDADLRLFHLEGTLPREPDHTRKRLNTGLWTRMIDDYYHRRTQFHLAHAAYFTALLPDRHPYFANLNGPKNPKIPQQRSEPGPERNRLLEVAQQRVERFASDLADTDGVRMAALCLSGRALLAQKRFDAAREALDKVIAAKEADRYELLARLGTAAALQGQGDDDNALDLLATLDGQPLVRSNLLYRLLVADLKHRVLLAGADRASPEDREQAVAIAYEHPYLDLLNDPSLGPSAAGLRRYVYGRWASSFSLDQDPDSLPVVVRMGIGEITRIEGQNLAIQADESGDGSLRQQAMAKLERAIAVNQTLRGPNVVPSVRARGLFNLGLAQYWVQPTDAANLKNAAAILTGLADEMDEQPVAEEAIAYAVELLRTLHGVVPRPAGVDEAYRAACHVLFGKFPKIDAAGRERLYYGVAVLAADGRYAKAAELFQQVPFDHPDYFETQVEMLFALTKVFEQAEATARDRGRRELLEQVSRVQAEREHVGGSPRAAAADRAVGAARLVHCDVAIADSDVDEALKLLQGFERDFGGHEDLIAMALERRIVALAEADRIEELAQAASDMMDQFPDAAAAVIDRVLTEIDPKIEQLRTEAAAAIAEPHKQRLLEKQKKLSATASLLADKLVDWARGQDFNREQMLPFELIRAKVLRLAGQGIQAVGFLEPLIKAHPDDASVIHQYAESLFSVGDEQSLTLAAHHYDRLIQGLAPPPAPPDIWWNAWMRRLQINDRLEHDTVVITTRVRQLETTDANLGGPRYRDEFERLAQKHAR